MFFCYNGLMEGCMQNKVKEFNSSRVCHKKPMPVYARLMDIESEVGELAKEYLKSSKYGTREFVVTDEFKEEFGDVIYAILSLSNEMDISAEECLGVSLKKMKDRMEKNNTFGSGR